MAKKEDKKMICKLSFYEIDPSMLAIREHFGDGQTENGKKFTVDRVLPIGNLHITFEDGRKFRVAMIDIISSVVNEVTK